MRKLLLGLLLAAVSAQASEEPFGFCGDVGGHPPQDGYLIAAEMGLSRLAEIAGNGGMLESVGYVTSVKENVAQWEGKSLQDMPVLNFLLDDLEIKSRNIVNKISKDDICATLKEIRKLQ